MMHVSAAVRVMPTPPAFVDSSITNMSLLGSWKLSIACIYSMKGRCFMQIEKGGVGWGWVGLEGYFLCAVLSWEWSGKKAVL